MATITLGGTETHTAGNLPETGSKAPEFSLTGADMQDFSLNDFNGKRVILNIYPSVDTGICAASTRRFNEEVQNLDNTVVICVSKDLPFAFKRFCGAEGLEHVITGSEFKNNTFSDAYNVKIVDGAFAGLMSRAVVIVNEEGNVIYTEQVPEIGQEPNYEAAMQSLSGVGQA